MGSAGEGGVKPSTQRIRLVYIAARYFRRVGNPEDARLSGEVIRFCPGKTMTRIASRVSQLNGEGALTVDSRAKELERQGRSIIHLELGEPDFHPSAPVVEALRSAVAAARDRYCSTRA